MVNLSIFKCNENITQDSRILSWISGYKIPFLSLPVQSIFPQNNNFPALDVVKIDKLISELQAKGAIIKCLPCEGQYLSKIFTVPKPNGEDRFILNLKNLNKFIETDHFKLEDVRTAIRLMTPGCYMGTIDLKDAYFLLDIHPEHKKYLRFMWKSEIYEFQVLPFGLNTGPYLFTKLLRPVMQFLRSNGHMLSYYLDDMFIVGRSFKECLNSIHTTLETVTTLGFIVNYEKSSLMPKTSVQFLGFILDSENYQLSLPDKKKSKIKQEINLFLKLDTCRIRDFARLTGLLVSACPATEYGWVYTKSLERQKYIYLKQNHGNYDKKMPVSAVAKSDLTWWLKKIDEAKSKIKCNKFYREVYSDSSLTGWGSSCGSETAAELWNEEERKHHINYLELLAAFLSLKTFCSDINDCEVLLRIDNTTAVSYINRMGGIQFPHLNSIPRQIWQWCENRKIIIFASYIKSELNIIADRESRRSHSEIECELNDNYFEIILKNFGSPMIDLFASRANAKVKCYVSWKSDPDAFEIDAFTFSWAPYFFYAFPPFALISKMLQKIIFERSEGIVVVPKWHAQAWYPIFMKLVCSKCVTLGPDSRLFKTYSSNQQFQERLILVAAVLSGKRYHSEECHPLLPT